MPINVVYGLDRGDEGKGRYADMLAEFHEIVARYNGGPNAGHTVMTPEGVVYALHQLPSGIAYAHTVNVMGNGMAVDPIKLRAEMEDVMSKGAELTPDNLLISSAAHLILPHHVSLDEIREAGAGRQGSTKSGIAPMYADKAMREGMRAESINNFPEELTDRVHEKLIDQAEARERLELEPLDEDAITEQFYESIQPLGAFVTDTAFYLNSRFKDNPSTMVLAEGAQGYLLDIDHGMYPTTTSSSTGVGGVITGLGVPPGHIDRVIGVAKAVRSHVGGGPFVTEIHDPGELEMLHGDMTTVDAETGTTTGRVRRLGYLDLAQLKRAQMENGDTEMALTKLDWVPRYGDHVSICVGHRRKGKELPVATDAAYKLDQSEAILVDLPTWDQDISDVRKFEHLPTEARGYIEFIEGHTGIPITYIGVGPAREQVIIR